MILNFTYRSQSPYHTSIDLLPHPTLENRCKTTQTPPCTRPRIKCETRGATPDQGRTGMQERRVTHRHRSCKKCVHRWRGRGEAAATLVSAVTLPFTAHYPPLVNRLLHFRPAPIPPTPHPRIYLNPAEARFWFCCPSRPSRRTHKFPAGSQFRRRGAGQAQSSGSI